MNGELFLDSTYLYSDPYGVTMRFANDPVRIEDSKLHFENFEMYASNGSPLNLYGYLDFSRLNAMNLNLRMRAQNFKLIDAKENPRSEAYGKAFVNFYAMLNGPLESLRMRGRLDVLGNTDMTYVMRDAQLTNDNQLNELVTFVNFYAMLNGPLESFSMRGRLDVLGNTDLNYVMRDAQMTNDKP